MALAIIIPVVVYLLFVITFFVSLVRFIAKVSKAHKAIKKPSSDPPQRKRYSYEFYTPTPKRNMPPRPAHSPSAGLGPGTAEEGQGTGGSMGYNSSEGAARASSLGGQINRGSLVYESREGKRQTPLPAGMCRPRAGEHVVKPLTESDHRHEEGGFLGRPQYCDDNLVPIKKKVPKQTGTRPVRSHTTPSAVMGDIPDLRTAMIWSEILAAPVSRR